jgi:hypothetical protein
MSSTLRQTKHLRELKRVAVKLGAVIERVTLQGHYHITLSRSGSQRLFVLSASPSDVRSMRNFKADVKRWAKEADERHAKAEVHETGGAQPSADQGNAPVAQGF